MLGVLLWAARPPVSRPPVCEDVIATDAVNVVRQLRTGEDGYEIELWSRQPFPVRAMPTILRIGDVETSRSRHGDAFDLRTLVFYIDEDSFNGVSTGDPMFVHHGVVPDDLQANPELATEVVVADGWDLWTFGRLDKSQLDCPPLTVEEAS